MNTDKYKNKYRIPSARAKWHSYDGGIYFITICTKNREHYFGKIVYNEKNEAQTNLTQLGKYTEKQLRTINTHYPYSEIPLWVIMQNHVHAIIIIDNQKEYLNDNPCGDGMWNNYAATMQQGGITGNKNPMLKKMFRNNCSWI
ncbi:MAG: hypothetical protein K6F33_13040 [Bacteroidales bacterium]|nr:hypothetical protein [Bacteroidales bacterium]